jgi:hypothetical protein
MNNLINLLITGLAIYFVYEHYSNDRLKFWLIFWAILLGWDLHVLLEGLLK